MRVTTIQKEVNMMRQMQAEVDALCHLTRHLLLMGSYYDKEIRQLKIAVETAQAEAGR